MAHPFKDKASGGAATAKARYAGGGGVPGGKGPFPGQKESDFVKGEQDRPRRNIMNPDPMGGFAGDSVKNAADKEGK